MTKETVKPNTKEESKPVDYATKARLDAAEKARVQTNKDGLKLNVQPAAPQTAPNDTPIKP